MLFSKSATALLAENVASASWSSMCLAPTGLPLGALRQAEMNYRAFGAKEIL
jgi:hypothetical protein